MPNLEEIGRGILALNLGNARKQVSKKVVEKKWIKKKLFIRVSSFLPTMLTTSISLLLPNLEEIASGIQALNPKTSFFFAKVGVDFATSLVKEGAFQKIH